MYPIHGWVQVHLDLWPSTQPRTQMIPVTILSSRARQLTRYTEGSTGKAKLQIDRTVRQAARQSYRHHGLSTGRALLAPAAIAELSPYRPTHASFCFLRRLGSWSHFISSIKQTNRMSKCGRPTSDLSY